MSDEQSEERSHAEAMIESLQGSRERMIEFIADFPSWEELVRPRINEIDGAIGALQARLNGGGLRSADGRTG